MEQRIPKIIHYVWVGGKPKPEKIVNCMKSWQKFCPDFELKEWNETNFDINSNPYVKEAYENKKFAFVSDYIRLYALYHEGGIYMDTDVEVVKPLDKFLTHSAFSGFENNVWIPTAVMGAEKSHPWIKLLLDYYTDRHFVVNGKLDTTTNVDIISGLTRLYYHVKLNNKYQELSQGLTFYPHDTFCPKNYVTEVIESTENTHAIHHFAGSWLNSKNKRTDRFVKGLRKFFGEKLFLKFEMIFFKLHADSAYRKIKRLYRKNSNMLQADSSPLTISNRG